MTKTIIVLMILSLVSCKEISFREPQPKGKNILNSVPKDLQGRYLALKENGELSEDTIVITNYGYRFGYYDSAKHVSHKKSYDMGTLGDSLVLTSFKGYYFLNINENPEWLLRVIKQEKNGDLIYMVPEQEGVDFKDYLNKLSNEINIDSSEVNYKMLYQIDPSPNTLIDLIDKGYFSRAVLKKIR